MVTGPNLGNHRPLLELTWELFPQITGVFLIPFLFFLLSLVLSGGAKLKRTSGTDLFVILGSLDLDFLLFHHQFVYDVYAGLRRNFNAVFAVAALISIILLAWSSRVQRRIDETPDPRAQEFPAGQLFFCWAAGICWMAGHFAAILIR